MIIFAEEYICRMITNEYISIADLEDIDQLVKLINKSYRSDVAGKGWTSEKHLFNGVRTDKKTLLQLFTNKNAVILKYANDANDIIGCVYLEKQDSQIYLGLLCVQPDSQASGIGRELLRAAEEYAFTQHCRKIVMTVISIRDELIAWYKRRGYTFTGEIKPFPVDSLNTPNQPLELLVLEREI
jgi:ribosomal protein S18 acetylase RimI-like enzyme